MAKETQIKNRVRDYLYESIYEFVDNLEDNLAIVLMSQVRGYNADWCDEEPAHDNHLDTIIDDLVEYEVDRLFANI